MIELAIIIPAYKDNYFEKTLESLAAQTNKNFNLYIGNDASPHDLESIIQRYQDKLRISYTRFKDNLGGKDLVAQWERCIDMSGDENWIWLFSDDDIMDPDCVENFYITKNRYPRHDLFHFNVTHIDDDRKILAKLPEYPELLTSEELLKRNLTGTDCFVVEFIFRKSHFLIMERFQHFDLAWFSDIATWIKLGKENGIRTIQGSNVYFRTSPFNITPNFKDREILKRKFYSHIDYTVWTFAQIESGFLQLSHNDIRPLLEKDYYGSLKSKVDFIQFWQLKDLICRFTKINNYSRCPVNKIISIGMFKTYRSLIVHIKSFLRFWKQPKIS